MCQGFSSLYWPAELTPILSGKKISVSLHMLNLSLKITEELKENVTVIVPEITNQ